MRVSFQLPFIIQVVIGSFSLTVNTKQMDKQCNPCDIYFLEGLYWPLAAMFCTAAVMLIVVVLLSLPLLSGVAAAAGPQAAAQRPAHQTRPEDHEVPAAAQGWCVTIQLSKLLISHFLFSSLIFYSLSWSAVCKYTSLLSKFYADTKKNRLLGLYFLTQRFFCLRTF